PGGRPRSPLARGGHPAGAATDGDDLPELRPVAAHDGGPERGLRAPLRGRRARRSRAAGGRDAARGAARGVGRPEIRLPGEPLSNLDASLREEMRFEIRRLHERFAITTLYVTHDQAE